MVSEGESHTGEGRPVPTIAGFTDLVLIGHGGSSTVFSATQVALQRRVALKVLSDVGDQTRRLEREARALGALSGAPHIVQVHDVVATADGHSVLVMPLLQESLAARVRAGGPQQLDVVARWSTQLSLGLDAAHRRGIAHRDIKPENVLLSAEGDAYLVDFGIADLDEMAAGTITVASISPPHAPPERFTDDTVDERAGDIYSLGSTVYFALAGRAAFGTMSSGGSLGLMRRITVEPVPGIDGLPRQAHAVIARAMAKRPADRYPDVMSFARDLDAAAGNTWDTPPQPPPLPAWMTTTSASGWRAIAEGLPATPEVQPAPDAPSTPQPEVVHPRNLDHDDDTVLKAAVAPLPATAHRGHRRRNLIAVIAFTALVGVVIGFAAVKIMGRDTTSPMELVVRDTTSGNPLPKTTTITVNGQRWNPRFRGHEARRTFDSAFDGGRAAVVSIDAPERVSVDVAAAPPSRNRPQVVPIVIGDDSVEVGTTTRTRNNPLAEAERVRTTLEPLASFSEQVWTLNQAMFTDGKVSYDVIIPTVNGQILPAVDRALTLFDGLHSTDPGVQAGIDAYKRCWVLRRAYFVEEANPGKGRVPADPAETYEQRRLAADQQVDKAAWKQQDDACKDPAIQRLRGH